MTEKKSPKIPQNEVNLQRRRFLQGVSLAGASLLLPACAQTRSLMSHVQGFFSQSLGHCNISNLGPLQEADENGLRLPKGFRSRVVARSSQAVADSVYPWHWAPAGGGVLVTEDGGWVYVSNSQLSANTGGAGALRFGAKGELLDAYPILRNTNRNSAGSLTPWGTWLSSESVKDGLVWECDPLGQTPARALPSLGRFAHGAVTVDLRYHQVYLLESVADGRLYRFTPNLELGSGLTDLDKGMLEVAELVMTQSEPLSYQVQWHPIPDSTGKTEKLRYQVSASSAVGRSESAAMYDGKMYFTTESNNRMWVLDTMTQRMQLVYDSQSEDLLFADENAKLHDLSVLPTGELTFAKHEDNLSIYSYNPHLGKLQPLVGVSGHAYSEIAGQAFNARTNRMYFSSKLGLKGTSADGITYEVSGPFYS